jgi:hypothetical protein
VGLERGPLSLVSTTEELLDRKVAAPVWRSVNTAAGIRHADNNTLYPHKLALTSQTSGGRSVGTVHSRIQATEFCFKSSLKRSKPINSKDQRRKGVSKM